MSHRMLLLASSFLLVASLAPGGELPRAEPEAVGLSSGELSELTAESPEACRGRAGSPAQSS